MLRTPRPAKQSAARAFNAFGLATFTIGAKQTNTINVAVQLLDAQGNKPAAPVVGDFYLSDNSDGSTLTATATTSSLAVGTNGVLLDILVAGKMGRILSKSDGTFDINVIQTASPTTYYFVMVMPDGSIVVSTAVTF